MAPTRPLFWNLEGVWLFYVLAVLAVACFAWGLGRRVLAWRAQSREGRLRFSGARLVTMFRDGLLGLGILRGDVAAGLMHLLLAWGFFGLFLGTCLLTVHEYIVEYLHGTIYLVYSVAMEVFGLMLLAGLAWALVRRYVTRVERLERLGSDLLPLAWLLAIGATGFALEGARIAGQAPAWGGWSFVGQALAALPLTQEQYAGTYVALWWTHAVLSLGLIAWLPHGKLLHSVAAPLNLLVDTAPPPPPPEPAEDDDEAPLLPPELLFGQLVSLDACTRCGRCAEACPSSAAGEPLSPRAIVQSTRLALPPFSASLKDAPIWYCTSCRACQEVCPIEVSAIDIIAHVRGSVVEAGSQVPPKLGETLERLYKYQNPWLAKKGQKGAWSKGLKLPDLSKKGEAEWLYFVGCTTSLDTRALGLANALSRVLAACDVSFGTLGKKEPCCGDIGRRVGELGLFEDQRDKTLKLLTKKGLGKLVTSSPHCFDSLANAYPERLDADHALEVCHYTQLLARLVDSGALAPDKRLDLRVTFHDPCYLARHNGIVAEPRRVLAALPGVELIEMAAAGRDALCCGGGGGRMWQEELPDRKDLAGRRVRQAAETGAQVLVTACPLCLIMLEDARKTSGLEERLEVRDLSELVAQALGCSLEPEDE